MTAIAESFDTAYELEVARLERLEATHGQQSKEEQDFKEITLPFLTTILAVINSHIRRDEITTSQAIKLVTDVLLDPDIASNSDLREEHVSIYQELSLLYAVIAYRVVIALQADEGLKLDRVRELVEAQVVTHIFHEPEEEVLRREI